MKSNFKTESTVLAAYSAAVMFAGLLFAGSAFAGTWDGAVPQETVKFQDLNVGTAAGVAALYQRIQSAARHVCNNEGQLEELALSIRTTACTDDAVSRAVQRVNLPALTAYYQGKTGRPIASLAKNSAK